MASVKDFSVEEKLIALLTLQKIDSKGDEIKTLKGELPMEVKDLEDEIAGLQTRIGNINAEIDSIDSFIEQENEGKKEAGNLERRPVVDAASARPKRRRPRPRRTSRGSESSAKQMKVSRETQPRVRCVTANAMRARAPIQQGAWNKPERSHRGVGNLAPGRD